MRVSKLALIGLLLFAASGVRADGNLVVNGNFATGDLTGWNTNTIGDSFVSSGYSPQGGSDNAYWMGDPFDTYINQSITTQVGHTYNITYWLASDAGNVNDPPPNGPDDFTSSFDSQTLDSEVNLGYQDFIQYSYLVNVQDTSSLLQFTASDQPSFLYLDDISVTDVTVTDAPEPGTLAWLFGAAIFGSSVALRRKKSRI